MARKRRRGTRGLGRNPAKGRGKYCVMTRTGKGKSRRASTRCFTSEGAAISHASGVSKRTKSSRSSVLFYRRKRG